MVVRRRIEGRSARQWFKPISKDVTDCGSHASAGVLLIAGKRDRFGSVVRQEKERLNVGYVSADPEICVCVCAR